MGIIVIGAVKLEEGIKWLERNFLTISKKGGGYACTRTRATWKSAKHSLAVTMSNFRPLERIESLRAHVARRIETLVPQIEIRARKVLAIMIDGMIALLVRARRRV